MFLSILVFLTCHFTYYQTYADSLGMIALDGQATVPSVKHGETLMKIL